MMAAHSADARRAPASVLMLLAGTFMALGCSGRMCLYSCPTSRTAATAADSRSGRSSPEAEMTHNTPFHSARTIALAILSGAWLCLLGTEPARACACAAITPDQGFERAEYVFTGKVAEATGHTWVVDVDRIWKGGDTLADRAHLLDVYAELDCEFFFAVDRTYVFFAIRAKSGRYVWYQAQVCNLTSPLRSRRVRGPDGSAMWLEDFILASHGPGERPKVEDPWRRLPSSASGE
jgi:hypothetical protein